MPLMEELVAFRQEQIMNTQLSFLTAEEDQAWQKIRGWLLPTVAEQLYRCTFEASSKGIVVEVGSFAGKSTVCIARALKDKGGISKMTAIDSRFQLDFTSNLNQFGVLNLVHTLESPSLAVADTWNQPISFIYIDGHHGKAHAYADFVVWESMVLPGGVIALDDTAGFWIGPSLQLQAALQTSAYELLIDIGGVSFLKKKHALLPVISDYPLSPGSLMAYVAYVSAWSGAMDPTLRLPPQVLQKQKLKLKSRANPLNQLWDVSPRRVARFIINRLKLLWGSKQHSPTIRQSDGVQIRNNTLEMPLRTLEWLEAVHQLDKKTAHTLAYLRACIEIQIYRLDTAIDILKGLCDLDAPSLLLHYEIDVRQMAVLRLAQAYDIKGSRDLAKDVYQRLFDKSTVPEIRYQAELGISTPFRLPDLTQEFLLWREYVTDTPLAKYRIILPQPE